jgi:hypothetical protein
MTLVVFLVAYGAARQHGSFFFVWLCTFLFAGITSLFVYILHWFIKAVFFSVKKVQILILLFSIDIIKF